MGKFTASIKQGLDALKTRETAWQHALKDLQQASIDTSAVLEEQVTFWFAEVTTETWQRASLCRDFSVLPGAPRRCVWLMASTQSKRVKLADLSFDDAFYPVKFFVNGTLVGQGDDDSGFSSVLSAVFALPIVGERLALLR